MSMQLPGAWQGVPAQAGGGAPMSGQQMAAAAAVSQQGGMVASYPIQQFQVESFVDFPIMLLRIYALAFIHSTSALKEKNSESIIGIGYNFSGISYEFPQKKNSLRFLSLPC